MHVPPYFAQHDVAAMHALMRARPLGTWVLVVDGAPVVNHIPFLLDADRGPHGGRDGGAHRRFGRASHPL